MSDTSNAAATDTVVELPKMDLFGAPIKVKKKSIEDYLKEASEGIQGIPSLKTIPLDPPPDSPQLLPKLVPIDKVQWKALTSKQRWDVITAMRGPDLTSSSLKWWTTAVLRYMTTGVLRQDGTSAQVNPHVPFLFVAGGPISAIPLLGLFDFNHFIGHVADAGQILGVPLVQIDRWDMLKLITAGSIGTSLKLAQQLPSVPLVYRDHLAKLGGY